MLSTTAMLRRLSVAYPTFQSFSVLPRTFHEGRVARQRDPRNPVSHDAENYFVDSDDTLPPNTSVYKVDTASDAAESAFEPPSGPWSRAGAGTEEYQTVSENEPYDVPNGTDVKLRYGGKNRYAEDKGPETSRAKDGPGGSERWGRKPEGSS